MQRFILFLSSEPYRIHRTQRSDFSHFYDDDEDDIAEDLYDQMDYADLDALNNALHADSVGTSNTNTNNDARSDGQQSPPPSPPPSPPLPPAPHALRDGDFDDDSASGSGHYCCADSEEMAPTEPPTAVVFVDRRRNRRPRRRQQRKHRRNHRDDYNNIIHEAARQHRADSVSAAARQQQHHHHDHHQQPHRGRLPADDRLRRQQTPGPAPASDVVHVAHVTLGGSFQHIDVAWQETSRAAHRLQDNLDRSEERSKQLLLCEQTDVGGGELCRMLFKGRRNE